MGVFCLREGRVKGKLELILEVEISMRQISRKLIPQVSSHQILHG